MSDVPTRRELVRAALLSGVLFGLSQPLVLGFASDRPIDASGLSGLFVLVCFMPLLVVLHDARPKVAYWTSFLALLVAFTIHIYWVVLAMVVYGGIPVVASIATLLLLTSTMAFWCATSFAVTRVIARRFAWPAWAVFPACLTAADFLRNFGPVGGFSWATSGNSFATVPLLLQGASLVGVYGLVFALGLVNATLAEVWVWRRRGGTMPRRALQVTGAVAVVWLAWGGYRLAFEPALPTVRVGMLQGNVDQKMKNRSLDYRHDIERSYHRLQEQALDAGAEVVVWPEAALPGGMRTRWKTMAPAGVVPRNATKVPPVAVVGAVGYERVAGGDARERSGYRSYNTAIVTAGDKLEIIGRFDKARLVPFGEYVPWPVDVAIRQIVPGGLTSPGGDYTPVVVPVGDRKIPIGTTICYEGIFPEITREFANDGAQVMFNVTNDAWYGVSSAATQHLLMYALRAAETGRAVGRAANTGVSAWVDTRGRVHDKTGLYVEGLVVADLPLNDETTLYMAVGDWVALPATVFALLAWCYALLGANFWRRPRDKREWASGLVGVTLAVLGVLVYFVTLGPVRDEANANIAAFGVTGAVLVGIGALSGRPWGRTAQLWVGSMTVLLCAAGVFFGSLTALPFAIVGAAVAGLAKIRKHAYVREADPELHKSAQPRSQQDDR